MAKVNESATVVVFTSTAPSLNALTAWGATSGASPSGFSTLAPGHTQATGVEGSRSWTVTVQPIRVDIIASGAPGAIPAALPPSVGDMDASLQEAVARAKALLPLLQASRVAVVLQSYETAADPEGATAIGATVLGKRLSLPADSSDLNLQFTSKKVSSIDQQRTISRITRWQTVRSMIFNMPNTFTPGMTGIAPTTQALAHHEYIDVFGTDPQALDTASSNIALDEVANIALRIYDNGVEELYR